MLTGASLDEQVETITAYVKFCVDMLIPNKVVKTYPNNKPWVTKGIADVFKRQLVLKRSRRRSGGVARRM